jgi:hypothetical protein
LIVFTQTSLSLGLGTKGSRPSAVRPFHSNLHNQ